MRILSLTTDLPRPNENWKKVLSHDVVIVDGIIAKNRYGSTGAHVGGSVLGWDEEKVSESGLAPAMKG